MNEKINKSCNNDERISNLLKEIQKEMKDIKSKIKYGKEQNDKLYLSISEVKDIIADLSLKLDHYSVHEVENKFSRNKSSSSRKRQNIRTYFISNFKKTPDKFYDIISEEEISSIYVKNAELLNNKKNKESTQALLIYKNVIQNNPDKMLELRSLKELDEEEIDEKLNLQEL